MHSKRQGKLTVLLSREHTALLIFCLLYVVIQLPILTAFPFVHSDETWLSGLSRTMLHESDIAVTEYFFDIYERNPHAVKLLFHLLQMLWIKLFGYSLFALRLLSLIAGAATLYLLQRLIRHMGGSRFFSLCGMCYAAFDIQFLYASHTIRQEIFLLLLSVGGMYLVVRGLSFGGDRIGIPHDIAGGVLTGLAVGFHPNGVMLIVPVLVVYGYFRLARNPFAARKPLLFLLSAGTAGALFMLISIVENPGFLSDYLRYGATLGVTDSLGMKISRLPDFYRKIFHRVSGTYYMPPVRVQFFWYAGILLSVGIALAAEKLFGKRDSSRLPLAALLLGTVGLQFVYIGIGRYGQPSVILNLPLAVLLAALFLSSFSGDPESRLAVLTRAASVLYLLLILGVGIAAVRSEIRNNSNYADYRKEIIAAVPWDSAVLANLNSEFFFDYGALYDWRNIGALAGEGGNFAAYVEERDIEYIVYPEELDFIYRRRPVWNGVYGNIAPLYEEMQQFLRQRCELVATFSSRTYAMRIVRYQQEKNWEVSIYRVR